MPYITTTDLRTRLGLTLYARLTDRENGTTADETTAERLVGEAEAEADSYLARHYATPVDLAAHPELAQVLAARVLDLAEWNAWKSSPFVSDPPQRVHRLRDGALRWLDDVARRRIVLPAASVLGGPVATEDGPRVAAARLATADEMDEA